MRLGTTEAVVVCCFGSAAAGVPHRHKQPPMVARWASHAAPFSPRDFRQIPVTTILSRYGSPFLGDACRQRIKPLGRAVPWGANRLARPAIVATHGHSSTLLNLARFASGGTTEKVSWWSVLNPFDWHLVSRETLTKAEMKQELPEVFHQQVPVEVEDYIRPDKTFFESLEDSWDWVVTFMSPVDKQMQWMRALHEGGAFGIDVSWGFTFVLWGVIMRLISLVPMLYAHRNTLKLAEINPQLNEINQKLKALKADRTLSAAERRIEKEGYKRMQNALYKTHGCSQYRSFASAAASPLLVTAFLAIRRFAMYEDDLERSSFFWVTDLTLPDPTYILPVICSAMFLFNFELNQSMNRGGRSSMSMYMRWGVRLLCCVMLYFFNAQPSAIFAYWIGLSGAGMLQPLLLRSTRFREFFKFPPPPKAALERQKYAAGRNPIVKAFYSFTGRTPLAEAVPANTAAVDKATGMTFQKLQDSDAEFEVVFDDSSAAKNPSAAAAKAPK